MPVRDIKIGRAVSQGARWRRNSNIQSPWESDSNANMPYPFPSAPLLLVTNLPPIVSSPISEAQSPRRSRFIPVPPARYHAMPFYSGKVKAAISGDSIILTSPNHPERERILSFAYCAAPRLKKEGDELGAFESRDALRRLLVGKNVHFQVLYTIPNTKREYGIVLLNENGPKFPEYMVQEGWLKLRDDAGKKEDAEEALQQISQLRVLEATARSEGKGLWATGLARIDVQQDMGNPQNFLDTWKGKSIDGMVERVLSGDRLLVRLFTSPTTHYQRKYSVLCCACYPGSPLGARHLRVANIGNAQIANTGSLVITVLAGIRAPTTERVNPSNQQVQPAEEYGNDARLFVEERLLQRNIKVNVLGLSPQNQLVSTIVHPSGLIAKALLEAGLARCVDFHSTLLGPDMATLRQAEKVGQSAKRGLFKDHVAKSSAQGGNLEAQVTRVVSADVIMVRNRSGVEKRISLSSVRGPRTAEASEAPFRDEAKEYLRKTIIGKHVRLSIDGSRPANDEFEAKEVATVTLNDKNIGLQLVQEGWCSVIRHRRDDTDRAPNYDDLLVAQEKAKEENKGMWSGKPSKAKQYADASETVQKAKIHLSTLQRQKKIPAIVDFVKGGSRFVILIPRESIKLTLVLGGIRAPKSARVSTEKSEPFGQEAHDLATRRLTQRDVELDIHNIDKVGGFIGELYINKESFAKILVDEGFATVHAYSAEQSGNAAMLLAAEQRAKTARKGVWVNWDPSMDTAEEPEASSGANGDSAPISREKDYRDVVVTNIDETGNLKVQIIGTGTAALETMMTQFKSFHLNPANSGPLPGPPKAGEYVSAKFTEDDSWYRARIRSNDRTAKEAEVVYIDYGNSEKIPWSRLRPLPQAQFSPQKLRPQAVDAVLSMLQLPTSKDYLSEAVGYINEVTANKELVANVDFTSPEGTLYITLYDPQHSEELTDSINSDIVSAGYAMVPTKLKAWERGFGDVLKALREKMEIAKEEHLGMWEYGDPTED